MKLRLLNSILLVSFFGSLLISNLFFFWVKLGGNVLRYTGMIQLVLVMAGCVALVLLILKIILRPGCRVKANYYPGALCLLTVFVFWIFNIHTTEESFQSNVKLRTCLRNGQHTARFFLREDKTFEDIDVSSTGFVQYSCGQWQMNGDTVLLLYKKNFSSLLGTRVIVKNEEVHSIAGGQLHPTGYYIGFCSK